MDHAKDGITGQAWLLVKGGFSGSLGGLVLGAGVDHDGRGREDECQSDDWSLGKGTGTLGSFITVSSSTWGTSTGISFGE